jgi:hypothetical protein
MELFIAFIIGWVLGFVFATKFGTQIDYKWVILWTDIRIIVKKAVLSIKDLLKGGRSD